VNWQPGRIAVLGEYGGNSLRTPGHMYRPDSKCCYLLYESKEAVTRVYVEQAAKLREYAATQGLSAAVYTETTDVEEELNGFFTYDRRVQKLDFERVKRANRELIQFGR
jgi:hypothetical protein